MSNNNTESSTIAGKLNRWCLDVTGKSYRDYIVKTISFAEAIAVFKPDIFNADTGRGEQRTTVDSHVRRLRKEMESHNFTPTSIGVSLNTTQQKTLVIDGDTAKFTLEPGKTIKQTDGGHRFSALNQIYEKAVEQENDDLKILIEQLPITAMIYLNGDPQRDFVNLQSGRPVDTVQLSTMKIRRGLIPEKGRADLKMAFDIAGLINKYSGEENLRGFYQKIKFDTRGTYPLKFTSLAARGSSDLSTSLVGLARVIGTLADADPQIGAARIYDVLAILNSEAPELLEPGMPLCPPPDGKIGNATLLIGVAIVLAYRMTVNENTEVSEDDIKAITKACRMVFGKELGDISAIAKRTRMGEFAAEACEDLGMLKINEVPVPLMELLSHSTYGERAE